MPKVETAFAHSPPQGIAAADDLEGGRDGGRVMRAAFSAAKTFGSKPRPAKADSA